MGTDPVVDGRAEAPPFDLAPFAEANPEARVIREGSVYHIEKPWGDETLRGRVPFEASAAAEALNAVRLPPAFSGLLHRDTNDLEFIFGPVDANDELRTRRFAFSFCGLTLQCEFADASERLAHVVNAMRPSGQPSHTEFRNVPYVRTFLRVARTAVEPRTVLTSFWLRGCTLPEDLWPNLARHLNFYMTYFDRRSPRIIVHEDTVVRPVDRPTRHLFGPFPSHIAARRLDPYMLTLSESGLPGDEPMRTFLYSYQVLEYAAFYYLKEELANTIRRIVTSPDIVVRGEEASRQILDALVEERTSEEAKIAAVVSQAVDPAALWREIEAKAAFFSEPTKFEGGFELPQLIKKGWTLDDFRAAWLPKVPDSFRKLRNALLHAREQRLSRCIAPSVGNAALLRPWAGLISIASNQVVLFGAN